MNYVPGFSNYLQRFATGGEAQGLPTEQPVQAVAEPIDEAYAQRLRETAQRAYENARQKSFGARGELSSGLERLDPTQDFNYSPTALRYMQDVQDYLANQKTGYNLTPMNVGTNIDKQTGALMPLTSGQLEEYAKSPVADQFYANFAYGGPGSEWDVGNLQFAPNQQYRLIDRATGKELYSGTGYEAGQNISNLAKGLFDTSGQQANWVIQQAAPGSDQWTQRYEHVPDVNGFTTWLKMVAPMLGGALAAPLGLAGNLGAAAGSAIGSAGAGIAAGDSIGDILKSAALSGVSSYAAGELFNKLGAGKVPSGKVPSGFEADLTSMGVSPATAAKIAGSLGGALPTDIVAVGARGINPGALASAAPALAQTVGPDPSARRMDYGDKVEQDQPSQDQTANNEIVVTGTGQNPGAISGLSAAIANAAATADAAAPKPKSTMDKIQDIADYVNLAGLGIGAVGSLLGNNGSQANRTYPGGAGTGNIGSVFNAQLPGANLPGLSGATAGAPRTAADLGQQGLSSPQDYYRYGYGPEQSFFSNIKPSAPNTSKAYTGYAKGGFAVEGPGDGREDKIPAMLSDGEYVMDAETVAMLGNGSNKAGAEMLDKFRVNLRKHKGREMVRGKFSKNAKRPEQYLAGGRA